MHRTPRSAVLPGALLALLVACGSLVALAVVIGLGSAQHLPLSFGGREATVTLRGSAVATASATRTQAAAPLLPERAQATITRRVSAGVAPKPADARADGARRPHTTLRGTAQHHSARRPAAAAPAPVAQPSPVAAPAPAVAAAPVPAPTAAPDIPTRTHRTERPQGHYQPRADRHGADRSRGKGQPQPSAPEPPAPAPAPETPAPQAPGDGHHRSHDPSWGGGDHGRGGWHRGAHD